MNLLTTLSDIFWTGYVCVCEFLKSAGKHTYQCAETESAVGF